MGINALTQMLVPPPKYTVDRLVPCQLTDATRVRELFIIERGSPRLADLDKREALTQLLTNTDDAYGFPPFRYLAPAISIGSRDYHELRMAERNILAGFLANVRVRTLASDSFGWADEIPRLVTANGSSSAGAPGNGSPDGFSWAEESVRLMNAGDSRLSHAPLNGASGNGAVGHAANGAVGHAANGAVGHAAAVPPDPAGAHLGNGVKPPGGPPDAQRAEAGPAHNGTRTAPDPEPRSVAAPA
jgi:hypothetical protein